MPHGADVRNRGGAKDFPQNKSGGRSRTTAVVGVCIFISSSLSPRYARRSKHRSCTKRLFRKTKAEAARAAMERAWRPEPSRELRWKAQLSKATEWLLSRQEEEEECGLRALDADDVVWRIFRSRRTGNLYYQRGSEPTTAEAKGLVLRAATTPTAKGLVFRAATTPTAAAAAAATHGKRRSHVFTPPARSCDSSAEPAEMTVGGELGRGAFATVLHASVEGQSFALKRALRARPSCEALLRDEHFLRALAGHEGVMPVVHAYRDAGRRRCLLLPLALGDLHTLRPGDFADCVAVAHQLGEALHHIHTRGVIHLDIKPQNVLVFAARRVRIGDFGSALRAGHPLDDRKLYEVTRPYRAPELLFSSGHVASADIDLWSLGALLWDIYPGEYEHPLVGAGNSVEQAVLVLALVGLSEEAAAAWGLPVSLAASPLPPFEDAAPPELHGMVELLLRRLPRQRSLRHLLGWRGAGPDALGGTPAKVDEPDDGRQTVDEIKKDSHAGAVA